MASLAVETVIFLQVYALCMTLAFCYHAMRRECQIGPKRFRRLRRLYQQHCLVIELIQLFVSLPALYHLVSACIRIAEQDHSISPSGALSLAASTPICLVLIHAIDAWRIPLSTIELFEPMFRLSRQEVNKCTKPVCPRLPRPYRALTKADVRSHRSSWSTGEPRKLTVFNISYAAPPYLPITYVRPDLPTPTPGHKKPAPPQDVLRRQSNTSSVPTRPPASSAASPEPTSTPPSSYHPPVSVPETPTPRPLPMTPPSSAHHSPPETPTAPPLPSPKPITPPSTARPTNRPHYQGQTTASKSKKVAMSVNGGGTDGTRAARGDLDRTGKVWQTVARLESRMARMSRGRV